MDESFDEFFHPYLKERLSSRLSLLLRKKGLRQSDLEKCSQPYLSKIISGKVKRLSLWKLFSIAEELNISIRFLLCGYISTDNEQSDFDSSFSYETCYKKAAEKVKNHSAYSLIYIERTQLSNFSSQRYSHPSLKLFCQIAFGFDNYKKSKSSLEESLFSFLFKNNK